MKNACNVVTAFCSPAAQEKIVHLRNTLEKKGLLPADIDFEQSDFEIKDESLFFVSLNKENEQELRSLIRKINFKKRRFIILSDNEIDYFDFALEYNVCNIIHLNDLSEPVFLGILKRFSKNDWSLDPFFEKDKIIFSKRYYIFGNLNMRKIVENSFPDFLENLQGTVRNIFIINCHELVTNAIAYGIMGVTSYARDKKAYDFEDRIDIPKGKGLQVNLVMDSSNYGISVRDYGGVLTTQRVLEKVRRQSVVAGETVPQGVEDLTGRGLTILSHHGLLMFSIKPGNFTEISLISHLKPNIVRKPISILATEL
ncbi:MAG: hypothetical protein LBC85_06145 [Fibromonadaceae bacterium]|jgi:hypothetical protein|nr:hypothetical protein [Fibromonadaceae bacterium]